MSWIAISDQHGGRFCPQGLGNPDSQDAGPPHGGADQILPRGTLLLETRLSPDGRQQTLLAFHRDHPWPASLTLRALPGGGIILVETQGYDIRHATLPHDPD